MNFEDAVHVPVYVALLALAFGIFGASAPVELPAGRTAYFSLSWTTFALLLVAGPFAATIPLVATGIVAPVCLLRAEKRRAIDLLIAGFGLGLGVVIASGATRLAGRPTVPYPLTSVADLGIATASLVVCFVVYVTTKEVLSRAVGYVVRDPEPSPVKNLLDAGRSIYALAALVAGPPLLLGLALFHAIGFVGVAVVLPIPLLAHAAIPVEVRRARSLRAMLAERTTRERDAARSEVTTRVAHSVRHEVALIGFSLHRIGEVLASSGHAEDERILAELAILDASREQLRLVLANDLAPRGTDVGDSTWRRVFEAPVERIALLARERGIHVVASIAGVPPGAPKRPRKIEHAWFNLLENAVSAADARVDCAASCDGDTFVLRVVDDGPGMTDEVFARASEPFFTTKANGTGMGLAIARSVAEEDGGELQIDRLESGIAVSLRIPSR